MVDPRDVSWRDHVRHVTGHRAVALGLATWCAASAAMLATKVACVWAVGATELGRRQLGAELAPTSIAAWLAPDLLAGLLWASVVAAVFGFLRGRLAVAGAIALALAHVAAGVALGVAAEVFSLFGTHPTWQLLAALGDARNATDSIAALLQARPLITLGVAVVLLAAGTPLLARVLTRRPGAVRRIGAGMLGALTAIAIAGSTAPASRFELDRNAAMEFARTALFGNSYALGPRDAPPGELADILAPVAGDWDEPPAALASYLRLRQWARRRPNVVLVVLESTAVRHWQLTGGPVPNTPNLSRLAERGLLWPRHYAHTPSSMFALYALIGGNHGTPHGEHITLTRPRIACRSLPEILVDHGYRAGLFHTGRFSFTEKDLFFADRGFEVMYDAMSLPSRGRYKRSSWGIEEMAGVEDMLAWIERVARDPAGDPFFALYVPVNPHHPYTVPDKRYQKFGDRSSVGKYRDAVYYMDDMVGRVVEGLDDAGVLQDTLIVFVGDHGEGFLEHPGSKLHGSKIYEEAVRAFALWYAPGALDGPAVDLRAFGHVDLMPTLLDVLGLPQEPTHPGVSATAPGPRAMVPLYTGYGHPFAGFLDGRWKYILNRRNGMSALYDLVSDPMEHSSVADAHPELVREYGQRVIAFATAQAAWEAALPDVDDAAEPIAGGVERAWRVDPTSCAFPETHFRIEGGRLRMVLSGEREVRCQIPVPGGRGAVTGVEVRGNEAIPAAFINASVQWRAPDGALRELAYCKLNGNRTETAHTCVARVIPARARFAPGGALVVELRYVQTERDPPFDIFGVEDVVVRYTVVE